MNNNPEDSKSPVYKTKKHPIPHVRVPVELFDYLIESENRTVSVLAMDCLLSDPFGTEYMPLITDLKLKSFKRAKKLLAETGFFEFKQEIYDDGSKRWFVLNLNGAYRYKNFLKSDYWKEVKQVVLERDNYQCCHCGATENLAIHHKTYEHHRDELNHLDDLVSLCRSCHMKEHRNS